MKAEDLLKAVAELQNSGTKPLDRMFQEQITALSSDDDKELTDVLVYARAEWGMDIDLKPVQKFCLKLIYGLDLDDRVDDRITEVISDTQFRVKRSKQFTEQCFIDIGEPRDPIFNSLVIEHVDNEDHIVTLAQPCYGLEAGMGVTNRVLIWDRFHEKIIKDFDERQFLDFLNDNYDTELPRCNLTYEQHLKRLGVPMRNVILRMGRQSGKTTMSQVVASFKIYNLLKNYSPQAYYKLKKDQPIRITLIATAKDQAIELMSSARQSVQRNLFMRQFIEKDSDQKLELRTQFAQAHGLSSNSGIKLVAAPCSARGIRGPGNILLLLEEYGTFYTDLHGSNKSDDAIYQAIAPSMAAFIHPVTKNGDAMMMIMSTPLSKESHMFRLEEDIRKGELPGLVLHLPSYWVNNLSSDYLHDQYSDKSKFTIEIDAEYSDKVGSALSREAIKSVVSPFDTTYQYTKPDEKCYMGLDVGIKHDGTSIAIAAVNRFGHSRIIEERNIRVGLGEEYLRYLDNEAPNGQVILNIALLANLIDELWEQYSCVKGMGDQHQMYGLIALLKSGAKRGIDFVDVNEKVNDRVAQNFLTAIDHRSVTFYADKDAWDDNNSLLRELSRLQKQLSGGTPPKIKLYCPSSAGLHDDLYSAVSRAMYIGQEENNERPPILNSIRGGQTQDRPIIIRPDAIQVDRHQTLPNHRNLRRLLNG